MLAFLYFVLTKPGFASALVAAQSKAVGVTHERFEQRFELSTQAQFFTFLFQQPAKIQRTLSARSANMIAASRGDGPLRIHVPGATRIGTRKLLARR